jgi:hypothetical protein
MIGWATMTFKIYVDISIGAGNTMVWDLAILFSNVILDCLIIWLNICGIPE